MAAIDVVQRLRKKNREVADTNQSKFPADYPWGTLKVLGGADINRLARQELRNHLEARELSTLGNKRQLVERLQKSVLEEQARAHADATDAEFELGADLEERGSVYVVGANGAGQLGLGDVQPRQYFTVVPESRGAGVCYVTAGYDIVFAVTEDHDVLVWGGSGVGPMGVAQDPEDSDDDYLEPRPIKELVGEEIVRVSVGATHALALSKGGDVFAWGRGEAGQLGLGVLAPHATPTLVNGLQDGDAVCQVAAGRSHSVAVTTAGCALAWGHAQDGRLGVGAASRAAAPPHEAPFFPSPTPVAALGREPVRQVACGPTFTLALGGSRVWAWGSGDGGVLGLGDVKGRAVPAPVEAFAGMHVLQIAAGTWHAAAVVMVPPALNGGYLYTWGSGYHGQLGLGHRQVVLRPTLVQELLKTQQWVKFVACGSHHNVVVTAEGELYSWGSNKHGCLGRTLLTAEPFTPVPGHVGGFGALVDGIGRGMPRSVACGKEFTVVATFPYEGPTWAVADQLAQEYALEEETLLLQQQQAQDEDAFAARTVATRGDMSGVSAANACSMCEDGQQCSGFVPLEFAAGMCAECRHSVTFHVNADNGRQLVPVPGAALRKL
ncbi:regulator of chromosome condensation 1/beta-lactamase-inhibitor protein II [Tribonema minus]|uniref:Regulator of chromosome condensation 1/beta-lactamase-inhibitor protein II n=1 Tax=Tribonema minus TaxID=303371 RepID=A0A835YMU1_9STRA|nr:regulator of chromosome condensation 1/beta-lactamase-inhibitor protein II [Tribonema minus]